MSRTGLAVVVLAAGKGTRMRSSLPKVLHPVCGKPMVSHVIDAARTLAPERIAVVVGHGAEQVREAIAAPDVVFVEQDELLGTADAVGRCADVVADAGEVIVLNGDQPLVTPELLAALVEGRGAAPMAFVTATVDEPGRLGRVVRDGAGGVRAIVEAAEAGEGVGTAEINAGKYVFDGAWLWSELPKVEKAAGGEFYLTVLAEMAGAAGTPAVAVQRDAAEFLGVDDRVKLAEAERVMRERILLKQMRNGVTVTDPATTYIDADVELAADVTVKPNCYLHGTTRVAADAVIGPGTTLRNAVIGERTVVESSVIEDSTIGVDVRVGPFAHVRGGASIGDRCELGNYAEVKNSVLEANVKMHHFSYVGDADVGEGANLSAGIITCNFDGERKHRTTIGKGVFLGSDTMLVAPVTLGDGSSTGAGSVVTKDVPAGMTVVGVPAKPFERRTKSSNAGGAS